MNWLFQLINPAATAYAEFLLRGLILSGAIYLAFRIFTPLLMNLPRESAATRHRILVLLFIILALAPILSWLEPFRLETNDPKSRSSAFVETLEHGSVPPISDLRARLSPGISVQPSVGPGPDRYFALKWFGAIDWPILVAASWVIAASILYLHLMFALYSLWRVRRGARILPFPPGVTCRRRIRLAESALVQTPMAVGLWSPTVIIPTELVAELSADDWHRVLRHEIAHLERYDDWANLLQRALIALNPFNQLGTTRRLINIFQFIVLPQNSQSKNTVSLG
jgi:hypothetical protein